MSEPKHPSLRVRFWMEKYPAAEGTDVYRWGPEPLPDEEFTEGRLELDGMGEVELAASGPDGHYQGGNFSFSAYDHDRLFRQMLAQDSVSQYFLNRQATLELLSQQGRAAELEWRTMMRGVVTDAQLDAPRRFRASLVDRMSSDMGALRLDDPIATQLLDPRDHPGLPEYFKGKPYPLVFGEHSDSGAVDAMGQPAAKGVIPLKFIGWQKFDFDGQPVNGMPELLAPPVNVTAEVTGAAGTRQLYYSIAALSAMGETIATTTVVVTNGPATLDDTNYVTISWEPPAEHADRVVAYRVFGRDSNPPIRYLALLTNNGTWTDPETSYADKGQDSPKSPGPQAINTAQVVTTDIDQSDGPKGVACGKMLVGLGPIKINELYYSDVGGQGEERTEPKRIQCPNLSGVVGTDVIGPESTNWPHPTYCVNYNGIDATVIYMLGPRLQDHIDGRLTAAVNVCGPDAAGDLSGPVVNQAFYLLQLFLNEIRLKNGGSGYREGTFGPLEEFADGTPMLKTSAFEAAQDKSIEYIGGLGYIGSWYIDDDTSLRTFLQWFCETFGCWVTVDEHGQFYPFILDETFDLQDAPVFREGIEILDEDLPGPEFAWDEIMNRRVFTYAWDPDAQKFRMPPETIDNAISRAAYKGKWRGDSGTLELRCSDERVTVRDAQGRLLRRRAWVPTYQTWTTGLNGLEVTIGQIVKLTHSDGLGPEGYVDHPFLVLNRKYNPNTHRVTFRGLSLGRILETAASGFIADGGGGWGWELWA